MPGSSLKKEALSLSMDLMGDSENLTDLLVFLLNNLLSCYYYSSKGLILFGSLNYDFRLSWNKDRAELAKKYSQKRDEREQQRNGKRNQKMEFHNPREMEIQHAG